MGVVLGVISTLLVVLGVKYIDHILCVGGKRVSGDCQLGIYHRGYTLKFGVSCPNPGKSLTLYCSNF